jgi:hypothetical protein
VEKGLLNIPKHLMLHVPPFLDGFVFLFINDVLSLNKSMFGYCVDRIYHIELEIKENTDTSIASVRFVLVGKP